MQPTDSGREPFLTIGEAVLERVRAVARRIAERVRRVVGDARPECPDSCAEQSTPRDAPARDARE
jgi:hypothetical protein